MRVGLPDRRVAVSPRHGADPPCCLGTERPRRSRSPCGPRLPSRPPVVHLETAVPSARWAARHLIRRGRPSRADAAWTAVSPLSGGRRATRP